MLYWKLGIPILFCKEMHVLRFICSFVNVRIPQSLLGPIPVSLALTHKYYLLSKFPLKVQILQKMLPYNKKSKQSTKYKILEH